MPNSLEVAIAVLAAALVGGAAIANLVDLPDRDPTPTENETNKHNFLAWRQVVEMLLFTRLVFC